MNERMNGCTTHCFKHFRALHLSLPIRELLRKPFAKESDVGLAQPATLLAFFAIDKCAPWNPTGLDLIAVPRA